MKNHHCLLPLLGLLFATSAAASDSMDAIQRDREAAQAQSQQAEARCYAQFAVHACLSEVLSERRAQAHGFRKRELVLHDRDREDRSREQLQRIEEKTQAAAAAARTAPPVDARATPPARRATPSATPRPAAAPRAPQPLSAEQAADNRAAFEEKQRAAAEHRAAVARRLQDKKISPVPLPVEP